MTNRKIREDKTCLNCGEIVEKQYCPECGQKNTESRRSFHGLFVEFFTTLLNYDNSFWRTIKKLFTSPGKLTQEYMAGTRKKYLTPVQLYLFVSFLVFFLPVILPTPSSNKEFVITEEMVKKHALSNQTIDEYGFVRSMEHLDSIHFSRPESERISTVKYLFYYAIIKGNTKMLKNHDIQEYLVNALIENLSKVILIYLPIFAFFLWLFHGKKRWYYFDSGVFTLHFFSFVLLVVSILQILYTLFIEWLDWEVVFTLIAIAATGYITFYFFRAHHRYFGESTLISRLKAGTLMIINTINILIILIIYLILMFIL